MTDPDISKAAAIMGRKGGKATALHGSSYFANLGKIGAKKRWGERKSKLEENVVQVNENQVVNVSAT